MKRYKTFIVENEAEPLNSLRTLLGLRADIVDVESLVIARSYGEAEMVLSTGQQFDISILDKFLDDERTCISLITNNNRTALGAIVLNSVRKEEHQKMLEMQFVGNYLVLGKPFDEPGVNDLLRQVALIKTDDSPNYQNDTVVINSTDNRELLVKNDEQEYVVINQDDLVYSTVVKATLFIKYIDKIKCFKTHMVGGQLKNLVRLLDSNKFVQISSNCVINKNYLYKLIKATTTIILVAPNKNGKLEEIKLLYEESHINEIKKRLLIFKSKG